MASVSVSSLCADLVASFARWEHIRKYGGSDPQNPDGVNMNLVRNHIRYYKRAIKAVVSPENYPAEYHRPTPPEVDSFYVAKPRTAKMYQLRLF